MLNISSNLGKINNTHGLSDEELQSCAPKVTMYLEHIHTLDQGFYSVIDDDQLLDNIEQYAQSVAGRYEYIVVLAIGGSSLGTICLEQAFQPLIAKKAPHLIVLDNVDPEFIYDVEQAIDLSKTLFITVTKSGGTPETLALYMHFRNLIEQDSLELAEHMIFITDPEKGFLHDIAVQDTIKSFPVPANVGGRFSVLTAVGLLPAALMGVDVRALIAGAREMRDSFLSPEMRDNLPFQIATMQYLLSEKGKTITVMYPYANKLQRFADWYRQLLAESIGKKENRKGEVVHTGLTPVTALGATDQHSQSQLYNDGPKDKLFLFLEVDAFRRDTEIAQLHAGSAATDFLTGASFGLLLNTEKKGTEKAYTAEDHPCVTLHLPRIDERTLGELFMLFEGATAFLGEYFEIDAFNQPGVEQAKVFTRELLGS